MSIIELKAKKVMACPGGLICVAEAIVRDEKMNEAYVTYDDGDPGEHFSVSKESVYKYLTENLEDVPEMSEEYDAQKEAKTSAYWPVFSLLKKTLDGMDKAV